MSAFLTDTGFDSDIYNTNYGKVITAFMSPVCPASAQGTTQVYNVDSGVCMSIPTQAAVGSGATASACGGDPFKIQVNDQCYSTNNCATSSSPATTCVNAQHVPVRQVARSGPGVLHNYI
jgi:hypothetical protein